MQPHSKQRRGRFFIGIFLHPQGAAVHRICSPWSAGETVCDFRRFLQQSCGKCRFCTFLPKPLDKTSADFSTKFSHFSSKGEAAFHSDFLKITLEKALIYKVLHTFHRLFHKNASFSWFDAVENSSFPHAEIVEKENMAKVTKIDEKGDYFDRKRRILRRFSIRKGRCAAGNLGIFVTLFSLAR